MLHKVLDYITKKDMIKKGDRIVVGVSGGADSICLLHVLIRICEKKECTFVVVHVNHGIRGREADRDERYVEELCRSLGVEFFKYYYDVKKIAKEERISEEEAGRNARYQAFYEVCRKKVCNKIAIAHNKNDNAETILFHLFRGTGIRGLSGIEPTRKLITEFGDITLIRPLLCVEREDIEAYLQKEAIPYLVDSTNLTDVYSRNKIRNQIITYITREINPGAVTNITEAASTLKEIDEYLTKNIDKGYRKLVQEDSGVYRILVADFQDEPIVIQKGILINVMEKLAGQRKDLESKHVAAILALTDKQVGRRISLPYDMIAERGYHDITLYHATVTTKTIEKEKMRPITVPIPGQITITQYGIIIATELLNYKKNDTILKSSCMKWFDYDKIENAVEIRTRKEGDYIEINASGGRKKLKDYFIDQKVPQKLRDDQILITDGNHIMWLPGAGDRMSERYKVLDTTTRVLVIKMFNLEE